MEKAKKEVRVCVRMDEKDLYLMNFLMEATGLSKSEVIRKALDIARKHSCEW